MKRSKRLLALLVVVTMLFSVPMSVSAKDDSYAGKTVILHSNDVHGAIANYAYMAGLKSYYEGLGAEVILADAGDFSQGTTFVSITKGYDAITMMNAVGYDIAAIGNHELDYGFEQLTKNLADASFKVVCADVLYSDTEEPVFDSNYVYTTKSGVKIGFFGLETPEAQTKTNPALIKGLTFLAEKDMYECAQKQADELAKNADIVICLSHLGVDSSSEPNTSYDLAANTTGIDLIIDGHSHTVMKEGPNGEQIQSTGTAFANVGLVVIDDASKKIESHDLIAVNDTTPSDEKVAAAAQTIIDRVNAEYDIVFAGSEVELNGDREPGNRTQETNLGDLITDSMIWKILQNEEGLKVDSDHLVAVTNGGGIRAWIHAGDVTRNNVKTVLPYGNTIALVYVKGEALLEALEASTFCTPVAVGGFPQVAGIEFTVNTAPEYDKNDETYPASTYYGPKSIKRVTINSINGQEFEPDGLYGVITNNFLAAGGDTYYALASAEEQFDTGIPLDEALVEYIETELNGVIGAEYAEPEGRIKVVAEEQAWDGKITMGGLDANLWVTKYGNIYTDCKAQNLFEDMGIGFGDLVKVRFLGEELILPVVPTYSYVDSGKPAIIVNVTENGAPSGYVSLAINMGNFCTGYGIGEKKTDADGNWYFEAMEGVDFPISFTFDLYEKDGYAAEYLLHDLSRTNNRDDYAELTDSEFANFRKITTTGIADGVLYRTSNPANPELGRSTYADEAVKAAGIRTFINLADSEDELKAYAGYADTYYSKQNVIALCLGVDFEEDSFKEGLAKGFRFMIENNGPFAVHCTEGKDRAGFVAAVLECLMGASAEEVVKDYMITYYNYYGIKEGEAKYDAIAESNIIKSLKKAFDVSDIYKADLQANAKVYLRSIGLTNEEIKALSSKLSTPTTQEYTIAGDDTLIKIAVKFYNDYRFWKQIYDLNSAVIENPDVIHRGQKIILP